MKTIFDEATTTELISRIGKLSENSKPLWGKMTVYQMIRHCTKWEELLAGQIQVKRMFLGRLFGKMALKKLLNDEKGMGRNLPTVPGFSITGDGDVQAEKKLWVDQITAHHQLTNEYFFHPFFGKLTRALMGELAYKHTDHHLRQFNC